MKPGRLLVGALTLAACAVPDNPARQSAQSSTDTEFAEMFTRANRALSCGVGRR